MSGYTFIAAFGFYFALTRTFAARQVDLAL